MKDTSCSDEARPLGPAKRVTIRDVARAAGVSVGAASTALRDAKSTVVLAKSTRERILKAAAELRYRPHAAARAMAGQRLKTLGVLATEYCMAGAYYSRVVRSIASTVEERGYSLLLKTVRDPLDMRSASFFREPQIDGGSIPADAEQRTRDALLHFSIPHVWVNTELREPNNCVHVDEALGVRLAMEHLIGLGHRRIGFMHHGTGEVHHATVQRERGYVDGLRQHGLEPLPTYDQYMDIAAHVDAYLDQRPRPTALVVYSDPMAVLACNRLLQRGVRIPEDISVVGNEGVIWHLYAYKQLSTVLAPVWEMGQTAVSMLISQIETGETTPSVVLTPTFEAAASTAPPPDA